MSVAALLASSVGYDVAAATDAATTSCSAAGNWTCGSAYQYHAQASAQPGSCGGKHYFFVRVPPPATLGESWVNATVVLSKENQISVAFNTGHTDTGVLSANCTTIHWADKSVWYRSTPPSVPPPSPPVPPNPLCTSFPGRPIFHMCGELLRGTNHTTHSNDINAIFWYKGLYHAMFQERKPYPCANWAHLVSRDLTTWKRLPDALAPTKHSFDGGGVLDGSVSLLPGLDPVIIYDAHSPERGRDCPVSRRHQLLASPANISKNKSVGDDNGDGDPPTIGMAHPADPSDPELRVWKKAKSLVTFPDHQR